jgi:hypothetical protein
MWELNDVEKLSIQHLNALRALRGDNARQLSKELDNIMAEIQLIDRELNKRKDIELENCDE